jgi:uncharacterized membrane protein YedE/YeeE
MTFLAGVVFAVGLCVSGMTQPSKIVGFLDFVGGKWDPSLTMVMAGAVTSYFILSRLILTRPAPVLAKEFSLPKRLDIDWQLIAGATLFGVGWGMVGFCPGPALVASVSGNTQVLIFVLAMATGMYLLGALHLRFSGEPDGGAGALERAAMEELEHSDPAQGPLLHPHRNV